MSKLSSPIVRESVSPDEDLVHLAKSGDRGAFEELYKRSIRRVYGLVLRVVGSAQEAEDVTQEAYFQVYRALSRFEGRASFYTWVFRIAMNVSLQHVKSRTRRARHLSAAFTAETSRRSTGTSHDPAHELERRGLYAALRSSIERLTPSQRTVMVLGPIQGNSYAQMSQVLGASANVIKGRLHRARERLKALLGDQGTLPDRFADAQSAGT